jgi:uncharacterized protein (TIGR03437 family)
MSFWRVLGFVSLSALGLADAARDARWQQDLSYLASQLPSRHPNLFVSITRAGFNQAVADLSAAIPNLTDAEVVVGLAQIAALPGDPHTAIFLPDPAFTMHRTPLQMLWFDDGLFVTAASAAYPQAAGARVIQIGNMTADQAYSAVATVISHKNDPWLRYLSPSYLTNADILEALKIIPDTSAIPLVLQDLTGAQFTLNVAASFAPSHTIGQPDATSGFTALYRQNPSQFYWFAYLPAAKTLYFKYNSCQNMPGAPFTQFAQQLLSVFDANPVDSFVVDFRGNTGGDANIIAPLGAGLQQRQNRFSAGTRVFAIIDRGTFSSGEDDAEQFKGQPFARLVGEPSGGTPNHYGNVKTFTLPNSGLMVQYATQFFSSPFNTSSLLPDVPVTIRSSDYFARHDPFLAAVFASSTATPASSAAGPITVVNSASFRLDQPVAAGSLASAFADFSGVPSGDEAGVPLSNTISGVQALVNGVAAPLLAVRPTIVNFQVPNGTPPGQAEIRVTLNGADVATGTMNVGAVGPGLFLASPTDVARPGAIQNQDFNLNSQAAPAHPTEFIVLYATGQGPTDPPVDDGAAGPSSPFAQSSIPPRVFIGTEPATVLFSGLSTVFPGLWQLNVVIPDAASVSGQVPVFTSLNGTVSNAVTIWVAR